MNDELKMYEENIMPLTIINDKTLELYDVITACGSAYVNGEKQEEEIGKN